MKLAERKKRLSVKYFKQGYQLQMVGEVEGAIDFYKKSIAVFPTAEAFTLLGWAMASLEKYEEAIELCHKAIKVDPDFGNPYNDIGAYLIELGELDEAVPYLEKATKAKRYDSPCYPYYNLGRIWEERGHINQSMQSYQKSFEINPDYASAQEALDRLKNLLN